MKNAIFTPPDKYYATMTSILLLLLQFNVFAQRDSTKSKSTPIYSLTDNKTKGTPTVRLRPTRFLVYKSLANSSNIEVPNDLSVALQRSRNQITETNTIPIGILNAEIDFLNKKEKELVIAASPALLSMSPLTNGLRLSVETLTTTENFTV